jgi:chemotaxis protein methyltransferase CheR
MARVAEIVRERTGLTFPDARVRDVETIVRRAMDRRSMGMAELLDALRRDAATRDALVADLTIGESYFQRDRGQFELLSRRIVPELLAAHPQRAVRVWSAGCASGEEPYSVAMIFDELGGMQRAEIIGTDIARHRLEDAQRGIYSEWALRGVPAAVREKHFMQRGRYVELKPHIRRHVDFRYLNLAEDRYPALSIGIWGMDVILCRNVLIYFDTATVELVARRLIDSLSEDGWLILGASDPPIGEMIPCDVVLTDAGLVYRRPGAALVHDIRTTAAMATAAPPPPAPDRSPPKAPTPPTAPEAPEAPTAPTAPKAPTAPTAPKAPKAPKAPTAPTTPTAPTAPAPTTSASAAYSRRDYEAVTEAAELAVRRGEADHDVWLVWLRALANQGRLEEAGAVADRALAESGPTAELLYLHAVLLLQLGRSTDAAAAARRALYLDRELVVAHLILAEAHRRNGAMDAAQRALRNAGALLATMPPAAEVPASDGELAGRLAELVRVKLDLLGTAA